VELQRTIGLPLLGFGIDRTRALGLGVDMVGQRRTDRRRYDADEPPRLRIADRRSRLSDAKQLFDPVRRNGARQKMPFVAPPAEQLRQRLPERFVEMGGDHDQNSIPSCAFTPARKGCLTSVISVTRSAASMISCFALRPVMMTWVISGLAASAS